MCVCGRGGGGSFYFKNNCFWSELEMPLKITVAMPLCVCVGDFYCVPWSAQPCDLAIASWNASSLRHASPLPLALAKGHSLCLDVSKAHASPHSRHKGHCFSNTIVPFCISSSMLNYICPFALFKASCGPWNSLEGCTDERNQGMQPETSLCFK